MKKIILGISGGIGILASLWYLGNKYYSLKKIDKKEAIPNPANSKVPISKKELEQICNIWDEIIYEIILCSKFWNQQIQDKLTSLNAEEKAKFEEKNSEIIKQLVEENENNILKEKGINKESWYQKIEEVKDLPEIKQKFEMLNKTLNSISKNEEPRILFDLPPQLNKKNFELIQIRNHYNFYYSFQKYVQEIINQNKKLDDRDIKIIHEKVTIEVTERKKIILKQLGITKENENDLVKVWYFALYNFSQDPEFSNRRQQIQLIFQKITSLILEGQFFKDLEQDPEKISDIEIESVIKNLKEKTD